MPTVRTKLNRGYRRRINDEAIAAWKVADEDALHEALRLTPGLGLCCSPLPQELFCFGVTGGGFRGQDDSIIGPREQYEEALGLQCALVEAAGWPDCRAQIRELISNLDEKMDGDQKRHADIIEHFKTGKFIVPLTTLNDSELKGLEERQDSDRRRMAWLQEALRLEEELPGQGRWREACAST